MINFLPSSEEYNLILKEYRKIEAHVQVFTDSFEDPAFHMGKISAINQMIEILNNCGVEIPLEFYDTLGILQMFSVGMIANLIGDKGYKEVLNTLNSPLLAKKDFVC